MPLACKLIQGELVMWLALMLLPGWLGSSPPEAIWSYRPVERLADPGPFDSAARLG